MNTTLNCNVQEALTEARKAKVGLENVIARLEVAVAAVAARAAEQVKVAKVDTASQPALRHPASLPDGAFRVLPGNGRIQPGDRYWNGWEWTPSRLVGDDVPGAHVCYIRQAVLPADHRLLKNGELIEVGDLVFNTRLETWSTTANAGLEQGRGDSALRCRCVATRPEAPDGWRYLESHEVVQDGDQFADIKALPELSMDKWHRAVGLIGESVERWKNSTVFIRYVRAIPEGYEMIPIADLFKTKLKGCDLYATPNHMYKRISEGDTSWRGRTISVAEGQAILFARQKPVKIPSGWRQLADGEVIAHGDWFKCGPLDPSWDPCCSSVGEKVGNPAEQHEHWTVIRPATHGFDPNK